MQILNNFATALHSLQPLKVPGFRLDLKLFNIILALEKFLFVSFKLFVWFIMEMLVWLDVLKFLFLEDGHIVNKWSLTSSSLCQSFHCLCWDPILTRYIANVLFIMLGHLVFFVILITFRTSTSSYIGFWFLMLVTNEQIT